MYLSEFDRRTEIKVTCEVCKKMNGTGPVGTHWICQDCKVNTAQLSLKVTFVSVMLLGGFLAITWLGAFILFIYRG